MNPETEIFVVRFDPDDIMIAAGTTDGTVRLYGLGNGELMFSL